MRQAYTLDHSRHQTVTRVYDDLRAEALRNHERKLRSVGSVDVRFMSSLPASVQTLISHQAAQHVALSDVMSMAAITTVRKVHLTRPCTMSQTRQGVPRTSSLQMSATE